MGGGCDDARKHATRKPKTRASTIGLVPQKRAPPTTEKAPDRTRFEDAPSAPSRVWRASDVREAWPSDVRARGDAESEETGCCARSSSPRSRSPRPSFAGVALLRTRALTIFVSRMRGAAGVLQRLRAARGVHFPALDRLERVGRLSIMADRRALPRLVFPSPRPGSGWIGVSGGSRGAVPVFSTTEQMERLSSLQSSFKLNMALSEERRAATWWFLSSLLLQPISLSDAWGSVAHGAESDGAKAGRALLLSVWHRSFPSYLPPARPMNSDCIAHLPPELCAEIASITAWNTAEVDKRWLAGIAATSQLILHTVKPILYHTVLLTDSNFHAIVACAYSGNFGLTRRLWVSAAHAALQPAPITRAFVNVEHFSGWHTLYFRLCAHSAVFDPRILTLRSHLYRDDWQHVRSARAITHLHLAVEPYHPMPADLSALGDAMSLQFVILEATTPGWNPPRLVGTILPFFFSCTTLERVLVCATTHAEYMRAAYDALAEYVAVNRERRLWVLDTPTDGKLLPLFRPGITFDPRKWTRGRRLQCAPGRDDNQYDVTWAIRFQI
ncbi:hypothetical protein AURDEDRAFT_150558 [Auricularia subglabra TFB-10046 SS5]|nr:hypothetical protein AURDEDRAFT_150558 [Auricularia subglabra TFB-10046 SS5]